GGERGTGGLAGAERSVELSSRAGIESVQEDDCGFAARLGELQEARRGPAAKGDVVERRPLADELDFPDEGAELVRGLLDFQGVDLRGELGVGAVGAVGVEVLADPVAEVARLADVERLAVDAQEGVDAGRVRDVVEGAFRKIGWPRRQPQEAAQGLLQAIDTHLLPEPAEEAGDEPSVAESPM